MLDQCSGNAADAVEDVRVIGQLCELADETFRHLSIAGLGLLYCGFEEPRVLLFVAFAVALSHMPSRFARLSATTIVRCGDMWLYRIVIASVLWPSSFAISICETPLIAM